MRLSYCSINPDNSFILLSFCTGQKNANIWQCDISRIATSSSQNIGHFVSLLVVVLVKKHGILFFLLSDIFLCKCPLNQNESILTCVICWSGVFRNQILQARSGFWLAACKDVNQLLNHLLAYKPVLIKHSIIAAVMYSYDWHWHFIWWSNSQEWFFSLLFWGCVPHVLPGQYGLAQNKHVVIFIAFCRPRKSTLSSLSA